MLLNVINVMCYAYSNLATACMNEHMADVCAICNGDVLHGTGKAKRLRLFEVIVRQTRENDWTYFYTSKIFIACWQ